MGTEESGLAGSVGELVGDGSWRSSLTCAASQLKRTVTISMSDNQATAERPLDRVDMG